MLRRLHTLLASLVLLLATFGLPSFAQEAAFPDKPVTIVVTFPAGGRSDLSARLVAIRLQRLWNQPVLVVNRPGAGGAIGSRSVAEARADGYTLLFTTSALLSAQYLIDKAPRLAEFQPLGVLEISYPVLLKKKGLDFSLANLAAFKVSSAPRLTIGLVPGATPHVLTEEFLQLAGLNMTRVPYKGEAEAVAAMLGGHIDLFASSWATVQSHVKAGNLETVAVASPSRQPDIPGVPTFREQGLNLTLDVFQAFFAPRDTPRPIAARIEATLKSLMADESMQREMRQLGLIPQFLDARQSETFMNRQDAQFRAAVSR